MTVTNQLCEEIIHARACPGTVVSVPVADALRLSERTGLPVLLDFNGKTVRISWNQIVDQLSVVLMESK